MAYSSTALGAETLALAGAGYVLCNACQGHHSDGAGTMEVFYCLTLIGPPAWRSVGSLNAGICIHCHRFALQMSAGEVAKVGPAS